MSTLTPITNKLSKLIWLLSSDKDGEVLAAVRAIGRMLDSEKVTNHDLAEGPANGGTKFTQRVPRKSIATARPTGAARPITTADSRALTNRRGTILPANARR